MASSSPNVESFSVFARREPTPLVGAPFPKPPPTPPSAAPLAEQPPAPSRRPRTSSLLTLEEYNKQGEECTKRELQRAGLYRRHMFRLYLIRAFELLRRLKSPKYLIPVLFLFSVVALGSGVLVGSQAEEYSTDGKTLVPLSLPARVGAFSRSLTNRIKEALSFGRGGGDLLSECGRETNSSTLHRDPSAFLKGHPSSRAQPKGEEGCKAGATPENEGKRLEEPLVPVMSEFPGLNDYIPFQGINLFSFALKFARDLASSVFGAFGWSGADPNAS